MNDVYAALIAEHWVDDYKILQVYLTDKYEALYSDTEGGEAPYTHPIEALALVAVTPIQYVNGTEHDRDTTVNELLGLSLCDGEFQVVNGSCNFLGLIVAGDTDYEHLLPKKKETTNGQVD